MTRNLRSCSAVVAILLGAAALANGRSVTVPVGKLGEKVAPQVAEGHGWPEGTLDLVNHPLRHTGWKYIFNTEPADETTFVFIPRSTKELKTIVKLFARIANNKGWVTLDPRHCQPRSYAVPINEEINAAVVFNIGSQKIIDAWFEPLPTDNQGIRIHNNAPLTKAPSANPPTLTIFVDNKALDLDKLNLPKKVVVLAAVTKEQREAHPDDLTVKSIDALVARHVARGGKTLRVSNSKDPLKPAHPTPQPAPNPPKK